MDMGKCSTCANRLIEDNESKKVCIECINSRIPFKIKQDNYVQEKKEES
ncbi:MAG: hypothetical protein K0R54_120 [Clostridiaceae bacterium]|jgi:hypothetical protein|nr:hypothetical protein [Clostridiaceae bacterium]